MSPRGFPTNLLSYSDAVQQDVAEATASFPRIIPGSPDAGSPSPLMVPPRDPSLVIEYAGPMRGRNIYRWSPGDPPNAPIEVSSRSPSPGAKAWAPIEVTSRSLSPFLPGGPRATPAAGVESVPVMSWGDVMILAHRKDTDTFSFRFSLFLIPIHPVFPAQPPLSCLPTLPQTLYYTMTHS